MNSDLFSRQIETYDTSTAFLSEKHQADKLINVQKRLQIRGYHISELYIAKLVVAYTVNDNFPFIERLNEINHRIQSSGLYQKWRLEDEDDYAKNALNKYKMLSTRENSSED